MTAKTLEEEAREAAVASGLDNYKHRRHDFADGYLAAATLRDKEIEELRARIKELEEVPVDGIREASAICRGLPVNRKSKTLDAIDRWLTTVAK